MKHASLGVFRFDSTGAGLKAVNFLDLFPQVNLIEACGLGRRGFWILLQGETDSLIKFQEKVSSGLDLKESGVIESFDQRLIDGIYSLHSAEPLEQIMVCESEDLLPFIKFCHQALVQGADLIEVKVDRGARGRHVALVTAIDLSAIKSTSDPSLQITAIDSVGSTLRRYLGPEGIT